MGVLDTERVDTGIVQFVQRAERNARFFEKFSSGGRTKGEGRKYSIYTACQNYYLYFQHSKVWVSCDGDYPADKEYIGPVTYYPGPAFPAYHFHAADNPEFLNPLVAVKFERASSKSPKIF